MNYKEIWEYIKEPMRWLACAVIAYVLDKIVPGMKPELIPYVTMILRFVDKWLYDLGKTTDSDTIKKGLLRF